jgi:hypothetical protein
MRATLKFAAALAVVFVVLELTARIHLFGIAGLDPRKVESLRDFRATEFVKTSEHPEIGLEHAPNVEGFFKLVPYHTNSQGLRDHEYALRKPPGTFRVAVLGSSFTVPAGVRIEEAFHSLMEKQLSGVPGGPTYEFINFAIGAVHPRQVVSILRLRALAWDPDLVLFGLTSLSMPFLVRPQAMPEAGHHSRPLPRTHPFFDSFLLRLVRQRLGLEEVEIPQRVAKPARSKQSIIQALGRISRRRGIPIVLVRLEFDAQRETTGEQSVIEAILRAGLYFLDTRSRFEGGRAQDLWIHPLDPHPNAEAHAVFAEAVTDFLRENSLLAEPPR